MQKHTHNFQLIEKIGSGGYADVYKAKNLLNDQDVAVKIITKSFNDFKDEARFLNGLRTECAIMNFLDHKNFPKLI